MRLKTLTLENFGPHGKAVLDLDSGTVGILGPNGSGKSNLLEAICFALTNRTTDTGNTYIRDFDPEKRQYAEVELAFESGALPGTIERRLTKSSSTRELNFSGEKDTADGKVKARLESLFGGAGLNIILEAAFIKQGELQKLLFGDQSEREKMFVKLLGLSHLEKVEKTASEYAKITAAKIVDRSGQKAALESNLDQARTLRDEYRRSHENLVDQRVRISIAEGNLRTLQQMQRLVQQRGEKLQQLNLANGLLSEIMQEAAGKGFSSTEEAASKIAQLQAEKAELEKRRQEGEVLLNNLRSRVLYAQDRDFALKARDEAYAHLQNMHQLFVPFGRISSLDEARSSRELMRGVVVKYRALVAPETLVGISRSLEEVKASLASFDQTHPPENYLQLEADMDQLRHDIARDGESMRLHNLMLQSLEQSSRTGEDQHSCIFCKQNLPHGHTAQELIADTRNAIAILQASIKQGGDAVARAEAEIRAKRQKDAVNQQERSRLQQEFHRLEAQLNQTQQAAHAAKSAFDLDMAALDRVFEGFSARYPDETSISQFGVGFYGLLDSFDAATESYAAKQREAEVRSAKEAGNVQQLQAELAQQEQALSLAGVASRSKEIEMTIKDIENVTARATQQHVRATEAAAAHSAAVLAVAGLEAMPTWTAANGKTETDIESELQTMRAAQQRFDAMQGQLQGMDRNIIETEKQLTELSAMDAKDNGLRQLVKDLESISGWFKRDGFSLQYVQRKFRQLTELTNMTLAALETPFRVQGGEKPVTFEFVRTDRQDGTVLPQNKLSGGQKVNLAIAFLLSFHKLMIPDFGIMVLDEPSLHLDGDAVKNLRDMLKDIATRFSTELQLIVCDHNPILTTAFGKVIHVPQGGFPPAETKIE